MNKGLIFLTFLTAIIISILLFPEGAVSAILGSLGFILVVKLLSLKIKDKEILYFLTNVFVAAFLVRILLASLIYGFSLENSFGPDATTYDFWGNGIKEYWWGNSDRPTTDFTRSGYGMPYIVATVYFFTGQNPFAVQVVSCLVGAVIPILAYFTSKEIFNNNRVARYTALFVGFFPAMIVWTSQLLKEGFIIFFLVLSLLATLYLQKKISYIWIIYLLISLLFLSGLRFYIFFMVVFAIFGGFVLTSKASAENLISRFVAFALIALALAYFGIWRISGDQIEKYGSLEKVQRARDYAATAGKSGINEEVEVNTASGAISALPLGLVTLLLAPFPWQVGSLTQGLTMPEMILWWSSLPFLISGLYFTIKTRFRESVSILFFTLILSLSYAIYQGNLGTIYRQRSQIQVFLLLFTAVGFALRAEKKEQIDHLLKTNRRLHQRIPVK
jgi:hypothetical protein